jgi:hypothetical protein
MSGKHDGDEWSGAFNPARLRRNFSTCLRPRVRPFSHPFSLLLKRDGRCKSSPLSLSFIFPLHDSRLSIADRYFQFCPTVDYRVDGPRDIVRGRFRPLQRMSSSRPDLLRNLAADSIASPRSRAHVRSLNGSFEFLGNERLGSLAAAAINQRISDTIASSPSA